MECLPVTTVPEGRQWTYEIKLDGYRLEAVKTGGKVTVYSRRRNVLNHQFGSIADALADLPDETVIDGEVVAVDDKGRANFNLLQNFKSAQLRYYAFDVLTHQGKSLLEQPLRSGAILQRFSRATIPSASQPSGMTLIKCLPSSKSTR